MKSAGVSKIWRNTRAQKACTTDTRATMIDMNTVRNLALRAFFTVRNSWFVWYTILNRDARNRYTANPPKLSPVQQRIVDDLKRDGIAFSSVEELFPGEDLLNKLQTYMHSLQKIDGHHRKKQFLQSFWDEYGTFGFDNPFFSLSVRPDVLAIVNSYDSMWRRFNHMHLQETIPVGDTAPTQSQRWHRDPQEKRQVKFFMYLSDVDSEAGPFTYAKGSQFLGEKYGSLFPQQQPLGSYPEMGAVEKAVKAEDIISATGSAGTIIFCDTAGLHRGGHAKSKSRFMLTSFYPSTYWTEKRFYTPAASVASEKLAPESAYALGLN